VLGALADAYQAASSLRPLRSVSNGAELSPGDLLVPRLTAPLVEHQERLAMVGRWVRESDDPAAVAFEELLQQRADEVVLPKAPPPGVTRR
jgi:hypothetical protein